jgi:hypothetical protein
MTSAAFSVPHNPRRRISIRHGVKSAQTATSSAADEALQQVLNRRARKRDGRLDGPGSSSVFSDSVVRFGIGPWLVRAAVLGAVGGVLFGAVAFAMPKPPERYAVAGTVKLDGRPLTQAVLEFQAKTDGSGGGPLTVKLDTNEVGAFHRPSSAGLPAGTYAVVVKSGCIMRRRDAERGVPVQIPAKYKTASSTPFEVDVSGDVADLELALRQEGR